MCKISLRPWPLIVTALCVLLQACATSSPQFVPVPVPCPAPQPVPAGLRKPAPLPTASASAASDIQRWQASVTTSRSSSPD